MIWDRAWKYADQNTGHWMCFKTQNESNYGDHDGMVADIRPLFTARQETRNRILNYKPLGSGSGGETSLGYHTCLELGISSLRISPHSEFIVIQILMSPGKCLSGLDTLAVTSHAHNALVSVLTNQKLGWARIWPMRGLGDWVSGLDEFLVDWWEHSGMRCYKVSPACCLCHLMDAGSVISGRSEGSIYLLWPISSLFNLTSEITPQAARNSWLFWGCH